MKRFYFCLAVLVAFSWSPAPKVTHAKWTGARFVCPESTDMWVSEPEAVAGRQDYVYCIAEGSR